MWAARPAACDAAPGCWPYRRLCPAFRPSCRLSVSCCTCRPSAFWPRPRPGVPPSWAACTPAFSSWFCLSTWRCASPPSSVSAPGLRRLGLAISSPNSALPKRSWALRSLALSASILRPRLGGGAGGKFRLGFVSPVGGAGRLFGRAADVWVCQFLLGEGQAGGFSLHPASPVPSENLVVMMRYSSVSWGNRSTKGKITLP